MATPARRAKRNVPAVESAPTPPRFQLPEPPVAPFGYPIVSDNDGNVVSLDSVPTPVAARILIEALLNELKLVVNCIEYETEPALLALVLNRFECAYSKFPKYVNPILPAIMRQRSEPAEWGERAEPTYTDILWKLACGLATDIRIKLSALRGVPILEATKFMFVDSAYVITDDEAVIIRDRLRHDIKRGVPGLPKKKWDLERLTPRVLLEAGKIEGSCIPPEQKKQNNISETSVVKAWLLENYRKCEPDDTIRAKYSKKFKQSLSKVPIRQQLKSICTETEFNELPHRKRGRKRVKPQRK